MFALLNQYLVEFRQLQLPGIGQLELAAKPAEYLSADRQFAAPQWQARLLSTQQSAGPSSFQPLMSFIAVELDVSEEDAFDLFQSFCHKIKNELNSLLSVKWEGLGVLNKNDNTISFLPEDITGIYKPRVNAHPVIHEHRVHELKVGETQTTNVAMEERLLQVEEQTQGRWWIGAAVLGLIVITLIVLRLMHVW